MNSVSAKVFAFGENACTPQKRRGPEGPLGEQGLMHKISILTVLFPKGLLQNAVFRPGKKIFVLKKLATTASQTVLANFFFGLIFQNSILQQALLFWKGRLKSIFWIDGTIAEERPF